MRSILAIVAFVFGCTVAYSATERDGIEYYIAHKSDYLGKEIQIKARFASVVGESAMKPGYVQFQINTEQGAVDCLVPKDRVDGFLNRYRDSEPRYLSGIFMLSDQNHIPYLLVQGF